MFKALIFDFDMTLVDYHAGDRAGIAALLELLPESPEGQESPESLDSLPVPEASGRAGRPGVLDLAHRSSRVLWDIYDGRLPAEGDLHRQRWQVCLGQLGYKWSERYLETWRQTYLATVPVYDGVFDLLRKLKGRVALGLLTNAIDTVEQRIRIETSGLLPWFDCVAIAGEIGIYKPEAGAFNWVSSRLGVANRDCLFVGDSEEHDIAGAIAAGMTAARRIDPETKHPGSAAHLVFHTYDQFVRDLAAYGFSV